MLYPVALVQLPIDLPCLVDFSVCHVGFQGWLKRYPISGPRHARHQILGYIIYLLRRNFILNYMMLSRDIIYHISAPDIRLLVRFFSHEISSYRPRLISIIAPRHKLQGFWLLDLESFESAPCREKTVTTGSIIMIIMINNDQ
jgi:hypothetical protein